METAAGVNLFDSITSRFDLCLFSVEEEMIDLFDLSFWRHSLIGRVGNQRMCRVPSFYLPIANAFCHAQGRPDCPEIPCPLVSLSTNVTEEVRCLRGGRRARSNRFDWRRQTSPALELFDNPRRKPSIIAEGYTGITAELYAKALFPFHDGERTKWGLSIEGESFGYYPSVLRSARLMPLFDITVGYDRRHFGVIDDAHLGFYQRRLLLDDRSTIDILRNLSKEFLFVDSLDQFEL
jgi:hypothetical protein